MLLLLASACTARSSAEDAGTPEMDGRIQVPDAFHADTNVTCDPGTINCNGVCTSVVGDSANCGSCGNACPSGTSCALGSCSCHMPMLGCGGECIDPQTSHAHCGSCGNACALNEACVAGACVVMCALRQAACDGGCIEVQSDTMNCGGCHVRCAEGTECDRGICQCPGTQISCGGHCIDPMTDTANCGACINSCGEGGTCSGGECTACGGGRTPCGDPSRCYDTNTSTLHCGACGHACGAGQTCTAGVCGCVAPLDSCGETTCYDFQTAVNHCGNCDTDCGEGGLCADGVCTCAPSYTMCGAECANVMTSEEHCGDCPTSCAMGEECRVGVCTPVPTFRILSLGATGCAVVDHLDESGDDHGGVAVSASTFFVNGDSAMVRMSAADLSGVTAVGAAYDTLFEDIGTEQIYVMLTAGGTDASESTATQLGVLDPMTGMLTATRIPLSSSITLSYDIGIFSGWNAAYVAVPDDVTGDRQWWHIELPTGAVTRLGTTSDFDHNYCETSSFWGIAERYGGQRYAAFVSNAEIVRVAVPETGNQTASPTTVASFENLSDMCSITFSTSRNRWYFHHEYDSEFGGDSSGETAGYCPATFDRP
jgi:hypothetical protein